MFSTQILGTIPCRLVKEKAHYEKEVAQLQEKITKMMQDGADEYLVRKQVKKNL